MADSVLVKAACAVAAGGVVMDDAEEPKGAGARKPGPAPDPMRDLRKLVEEPIPPGQEVLMQLRLAAWKRHLYTKEPLPPELEGWDRL